MPTWFKAHLPLISCSLSDSWHLCIIPFSFSYPASHTFSYYFGLVIWEIAHHSWLIGNSSGWTGTVQISALPGGGHSSIPLMSAEFRFIVSLRLNITYILRARTHNCCCYTSQMPVYIYASTYLFPTALLPSDISVFLLRLFSPHLKSSF